MVYASYVWRTVSALNDRGRLSHMERPCTELSLTQFFRPDGVILWQARTVVIPLTRLNCWSWYRNRRKDKMDIQSIVTQLRQEASRIEHAIGALTGIGSQPARRGRPPKGKQLKPVSGKKRRRMSAPARAKIAAAQRARWAKQKGRRGPKKGTAVSKKTTGRKPMGAAMRKKLSALMKKRWAERKA